MAGDLRGMGAGVPPPPQRAKSLGNVIQIENMAPKEIRTLTPTKLAAFYKQVGGDLDGKFIFCFLFLSLLLFCLA